VSTGCEALESIEPGLSNDAKFVFHIPPYNSIDHLHLHVIARPDSMGTTGKIKYSDGRFWCMTAEKAIQTIFGGGGKGNPGGGGSKL